MAGETKLPVKLIAFVAIIVTFSSLAVAWFKIRELSGKQSAFTGCYSDTFGMLKQHLEKYSADNGGRFPSLEELKQGIDAKERDWLLTCHGNKQPLQWNPQLASIKLSGADRRLLAWCPEGAHGNYSGVILLDHGEVKLELMTIGELQEQVKTEAKLHSANPKAP